MNDGNRIWSNIATVERETGLGKDTLRVWERRYGFPQPMRDGNGDRLYSMEQVTRLRLIKRLMDRGYRPGKVVPADESDLQEWAAEPAANQSLAAVARSADSPAVGLLTSHIGKAPEAVSGLDEVFEALGRHDVTGLRRVLSQLMAREGLQRFVMDIVPLLNYRVGEGWESGQIEVFEEHLYTEQMQVLLRQSIAGLPPGSRRPKILLTTVPEEQHVLGILMLESLLTLQGLRCVSLGTQMPLTDIVSAVKAHAADVVALSFSGAFPARQILPLVTQLRSALPQDVGLWVGGGGLDKGFERRLDKALVERGLKENERSAPVTVCRSLKEAVDCAEQVHLALN